MGEIIAEVNNGEVTDTTFVKRKVIKGYIQTQEKPIDPIADYLKEVYGIVNLTEHPNYIICSSRR